MRVYLLFLLALAGCSRAEVSPSDRHGWACLAAGPTEPPVHKTGHIGFCDGGEPCARVAAIKQCERYHEGCTVVMCRIQDRTDNGALDQWPR